MADSTSDLASAIRSLSPMSRWYVVHSAMSALVAWRYADHAWEVWPVPMKLVAWSWPICTVLVAFVLMVNGIVMVGWKLWQRMQAPAEVVRGPRDQGPAALITPPKP